MNHSIDIRPVQGQNRSWAFKEKVGEGVTGEVFLVESLLEKKSGILKRPLRTAFASEAVRQASQIGTEGRVLKALGRFSILQKGIRFCTPELLDQSLPGTEFSDRFFIVLSTATGWDLENLARTARLDLSIEGPVTTPQDLFLQAVSRQGKVPQLVLLRAIYGLILFLEGIHSSGASAGENTSAGILWNDIKPEHIFWNPAQRRFTIIDWSNGQFLEADGATRDRRFSRNDDYYQFLQSMGNFLKETSPELYMVCDWPGRVTPLSAYRDGVLPIKERIKSLLEDEEEKLEMTRRLEADQLQIQSGLVGSYEPTTASDIDAEATLPLSPKNPVTNLSLIHEQIFSFGEIPDYAATERYYQYQARLLALDARLDELAQFCQELMRLPIIREDKWRLIQGITLWSQKSQDSIRQELINALIAATKDDWPSFLWSLLLIATLENTPAWWDAYSQQVRQIALEIPVDTPTPMIAVRRAAISLQTALNGASGKETRPSLINANLETSSRSQEQRQSLDRLVQTLKDSVLSRWTEIEPSPPDANLEYREISRLLGDIRDIDQSAYLSIERALEQPKAQVKILLDAWSGKEFEQTRRALRMLLLWDPDRWRVISAEHAIPRAPIWLEKARRGPNNASQLTDFLSEIELEGRELRHRVGPALWLDLIVDTCAKIRKGTLPVDVITEHPEITNEMPWLKDFQPAPQTEENKRVISLDRKPHPARSEPTVNGKAGAAIGQDQGLYLLEPLDAWAPEARGSSARVFLGLLQSPDGRQQQSAIKVMRADRQDYALPLFQEEVRVLQQMSGVDGVVELFECGFIRPAEYQNFPNLDSSSALRSLRGEVIRYSLNDLTQYEQEIVEKAQEGWLPYLALEKRNPEENLMVLCDSGYTHGRFLPIPESVRLNIQLCEILEEAHRRNVVYRDHKIVHFYWREVYNGVDVIDWNVARYHPDGLSQSDIEFDLVQFSARALHHILTGRVAPGALPLGPTRPDEIDQASHSYRVQWTYDDQRLPRSLRELIERALLGDYHSAADLRKDLLSIFQSL